MPINPWNRLLKHKYISVNNISISTYSEIEKNKPLAVFFHGFGGNYFGLTPLAHELSCKYSILIVELPSHGKSSIANLDHTILLNAFYISLINIIKKEFEEPKIIIAHSFGCFIAKNNVISKKIPTVLICPVYTPSSSFLKGMFLSQKSSLFMVLSNIPILSPFKALFLQRRWSLQAFINIFENIFYCQNSIKQLLSQQNLIDIALKKDIFFNNYVKLVINGKSDNTIDKNKKELSKKLFKHANIVDLKGGHLLPMESPKEIAKTIINYF